jgi:5-methylcytosine-specific restriction endonuclease McrA
MDLIDQALRAQRKRRRARKKAAALEAKLKRGPYKPRENVQRNDHIASDAFLASYEWRRVRMMALKTYGPRCMCCGATPADGAVMNVDHIKPRLKFPKLALTLSNLQILCGPCNHGKGNWDMTDWRPTAESIDPDVVSLIRDIARNG